MDASVAAGIVADLDTAIWRIALNRATRFMPAEDLAQEGRITAWMALCDRFRAGDPHRYAVTAATRGMRMAVRRYGSLVRGVSYSDTSGQARWATIIPIEGRNLQVDVSDDGAGDPVHSVADESSLDALLAWCLGLLPRRQYQAVWLHAALGYGHPEVARMLGLTPSTVETYYRRGLTTLRRNRRLCPASVH